VKSVKVEKVGQVRENLVANSVNGFPVVIVWDSIDDVVTDFVVFPANERT
jgi:hypothetical protein